MLACISSCMQACLFVALFKVLSILNLFVSGGQNNLKYQAIGYIDNRKKVIWQNSVLYYYSLIFTAPEGWIAFIKVGYS